MPGTSGPNLGVVWGWAPHEDGWGVGGFNPNFAKLDALVHLAVLDRMNSPPSVLPAAGDRYIVGTAGAGLWAGHSNTIAVFGTTDWSYYAPKTGWRAWNSQSDSVWMFDGTGWVEKIDGFDFVSPVDNDVIVYDGGIGKFINVRPLRAFSFGSDPASLLTANQPLFYHRFSFPFRIPPDFGDYRSASSTLGGTAAATAAVVLRVQKAVAATPLTFTNAGTITVGAGTVNATFNSSATVINFAKGDVLRILAPATPDSGFSGPFGTIVGYET
jgi:hypothetical protein